MQDDWPYESSGILVQNTVFKGWKIERISRVRPAPSRHGLLPETWSSRDDSFVECEREESRPTGRGCSTGLRRRPNPVHVKEEMGETNRLVR